MISVRVMNTDAEVVISLVRHADLLNKVEAATKERSIFGRWKVGMDFVSGTSNELSIAIVDVGDELNFAEIIPVR